MEMTLGRLLTVTEFAEACGLTPGRIRQLVASGEIPTTAARHGEKVVMHFIDPKHVKDFSSPNELGRKRKSESS